MGFGLFKEMISARGISADALCSLSAIKCCIKMGSFRNGLQIHCRTLRDGNISDCFLSSNLVDFYSANGEYEEAYKVFAEMPYRDTFAWNSFISCNLKNKRTRNALTAFHIMERSERHRPDEVTCLYVLGACANLNALEFGEGVHNYVKRCGLNGSMKISNSLIAMYSKCGSVEKAYEVFKEMPTKDVVTWSAMISGLASNGYGRQAIEAFREMLRVGVTPDDQTFTGVLSACSHSGLVREGVMFFDSMIKEFGILPNIYHYGCIVDLMGRAGLLDKAYETIATMKAKPDATIWRTLLGACRIHRHPVLGQQVVEHLIELKAEEAGDYVLLLNIYSSVGVWDKVTEVRKLMKEKGIHTTPAYSSIEVNGKIHEFVADDTSHPRKRDIYEKLEEINDQLRIAGYVSEITAELHNTKDVEIKRTTLSYHSEKLAIAYGVLATPPGTKIRVAKDLRICVDCHNFAKILSAVYNREVVVRDRNRSHHFNGGFCSCHDYW